MDPILEKLTAAPKILVFKGVTYELAPLGLRELAQARAFVKRYILEQAQKDAALMLKVDAPAEHIRILWDEATKACKHPLETDFMQDPEPAVELARLSLCRKHPNITQELITEMLEDPTVQAVIFQAAKTLNEVEGALKNG